MQTPHRSANLLVVLLGLLASSCLSFATGGESVRLPKALGTAPPRVAVLFEGAISADRNALSSALAETRLFHSTVAAGESADLILVIERYGSSETHLIGLFNMVLLGILPLPFETTRVELRTKLRVGLLPDVELPKVERKQHVWGGIPLLLFAFIQVDEDAVRTNMSREVAAHVAREYAALHERSWAAALASDSPDELERFVSAFAVSPHVEHASEVLEEKLFAAFERRGDGASVLRYLHAFRSGARSETVRARGASVLFDELRRDPDPARLEEYIDLFPLGARTPDAVALLDDVLWNSAEMQRNDAARYQAYAARFPGGKHAAEVRDVLAWITVERIGTPEAVAAYLNEHPTGRFAEQALSAIAIQTDPTRLATAAAIPELLDNAIPRYESSFSASESITYHGSILNVVGGSTLSFSYFAEYRKGSLASYEVLTGSVNLDGQAYGLAADGRWYPRFARVFQ